MISQCRFKIWRENTGGLKKQMLFVRDDNKKHPIKIVLETQQH